MLVSLLIYFPDKENAVSCSSLVSGCMDIKSLFQQNNLKHQRCLKVPKWDPLRKEMVEQLQEQMQTANINKTLISNMFHSDFKYHLKALNTLLEDLNATDDNKSGLICNLDLVLKWMTLRFFDTNPSVLIKSLEYLQQMFDMLIVKKYTLLDIEVSCFVPYLITKLGDPKNTVRSNVRSILKQIVSIFPGTKVFIYIMDGINSKNSRQHSECLEHLTTMIEDHGSSICHPSVEDACKRIAISIGDTSVRRPALDCLVALFFSYGDDILKFLGHIPEKNMDILKERLKRAPMNEVVPVATVQPTVKMSISPIQKVLEIEDAVYSDDENYNNMSNVLEESNHDQSLKKYSDNLLPRKPDSEITNKPRLTRFSLDEKIIRELDAEVIIRPKLSLTPYKWTTELEETNFKKAIQMKSQYLVDNLLSEPYHNVNLSYSAAKITRHPVTSPFPVNLIEQLINEVTSPNSNISKAAMTSLNKILLKSNIRSKFLETGKVLPLYFAIIKQLGVFEYHDIVGYKMLLHLCLNMCKYQEFMLTLNGQIVRDLLSKLLRFLSNKGPENCNDIIGKCVNSLIMSILEQTDHTIVTCTLLVMIHDMIKYPETSTNFFKELLIKCLWKVIKDFQNWDSELNYDLVLVHIHKFLQEFDLNYWRKQPSDTPLRTYKTVLHTLVKLHSDKILKSLSSLQLPDDSEIVMYLLKLLQHQKNKQS